MTDKHKKTEQAKAAPVTAGRTAGANSVLPGNDLNINKESDWFSIRQKWMQERMQSARAHADRLFMTDEELPLSRHLLLLAIVAFFVLFFLWASWATLDEVTRGDGRIIPSSEVQALQSLEGGVVDELLVREGDDVTAGQVLVRLRDAEATSDLGSNRARYLGLLASVTRLQAEAEGKESVEFPDEVVADAPQSVREELNAFRANRQRLDGQLQILRQQKAQRVQEVEELTTRISDARQVIAISQEEYDMLEPLVARGSAPRLELLQLERAMKEKQSELNSLLTALPRSRSAVQEADARIEDATSTARAEAQIELSSKLTEMRAIEETLLGLRERKGRTEIRSPVDGIIKDLKANTIGGVVRPGENIVEIVPVDDQLLVEARIRPSDIAFIYPGQPAIVKVTAYDYSIYGGLNGEVVDISADTITNEKGESFYRVRLRTEESSLDRKGEVLPIIPGMVTSVDILTGEKTVMQYILKPFIKTLGNAMNER
ncbi:MAG: HlyD family type I secretion periplasmic adaptor subunit [Alphaproteobacteria bacterium]|nr:HlyD family type I secretion periplasmic adaptor subunit [Alphaproteobacteria bacterium]